MDLATLIARLRADGALARVGTRPLAQFGTRSRRYIGAEILPERNTIDNAFEDDQIRYRTIIANAGTRYSPVQLKAGALVGSVLVVLGESDIGSELTSREYDALLRHLGAGSSMQAMAQVINFVDTTINRALVEYNEMQRWQAMIRGVVTRRGDNAYVEEVPLPNPEGHRLDAETAWDDPDVDPFDEIHAAVEILRDKGYEPARIITRSQVVSMIAQNPNTKMRTGRITIVDGGGVPTLRGLGGRTTIDEINAQLTADNLPAMETYDLKYQTNAGSVPFLDDGAMLITAVTDRTEEIAIDENEVELLEGTLGYVGVGRAAGQSGPGRVIIADHKEDKPPRIEAQGWQTSFPVLQEPEAMVAIRNITTGTEEEED